MRTWIVRFFVIGLAGLLAAYAVFRFVTTPSHSRIWATEQALLPRVKIDGDTAVIENFRRFRYRTPTDFDATYDTVTLPLDRLERAWYVLVPFKGKEDIGFAHSFLTFGFADGQYVSVSVEARREQSEKYSPFKGLLRRYELIYVIGDEEDIIGLRSIAKNEDTYLYPLALTPAEVRSVFVDMLADARRLEERPEFYNTLTNMCTTRTVKHLNVAKPGLLPTWNWRIAVPGFSDRLFAERGAFDGSVVPDDTLRATARINERAQDTASALPFSARIRSVPQR